MRNVILKSSSFALLLFGVYNLFIATSVFFFSPELKKQEGNFIYFIVFVDLSAAVIYLVASYGFFIQKTWATPFLFFSTFFFVISFIGLLFHALSGGSYDESIIMAITLRTFITCVFTGVAWKYLSKKMELPAY
ncbi:MAG TPA: hypothetical protein VIJ75_14890 [Hanamia sp.]